MQQIICTDRQSIEEGLVVRSTYAVVSIRDPGSPRARVRRTSGLQGVLHLAFHDAEPAMNLQLPPDIKLVTRRQALAIWQFVDEQTAHVGAFVVHCHQGMSRSPAVAAAIAEYLGYDASKFFSQYTPNRYVYEMLRSTAPPRPNSA